MPILVNPASARHCTFLDHVFFNLLPSAQESFKPITDDETNSDLIEMMVHATSCGDYDFTNMYTAVLCYR